MNSPGRPFPGLAAGLGLLVLGFGVLWGSGAALAGLLNHSSPTVWTFVTGMVNLVVLLALAAFGYALSRVPPAWVPNQGARPGYAAGLVLAAAGGTVVLTQASNLMELLVPVPAAWALVFAKLSEANPWVALFTLAAVAPVTEELLFRGLLLRGFALRYGTVPGLVLSSALFALFHANLWQAVPAFLAGLYLGWLYLQTKSVAWPMTVHGVFNGLPLVLASLGFKVGGYNVPPLPGTVEFQPLPWVAAGTAALALGLVMTKRCAPLSPPPVSDTVAP